MSETGVEVGRLRDLIEGAGRTVIFTGAGISTELGILDFRGPGGLWSKVRPVEFGEVLAILE